MKCSALLSLTMAAVLLLAACHKNSTPTPTRTTTTAPTGPYLYIGGTNYTNAQYWKISLSAPAANPVPDTRCIVTRSSTFLLAVDSTIYMAADTGGYWIRDSFVTVTGSTSIQYLSVSGSTVYTTGFDALLNMAFWVNNFEVNLQSSIDRNAFPYEGLFTFGPTGIASVSIVVQVSGNLFFENEPLTPDTVAEGNFGLLWTNGVPQLYGKGAFLTADYRTTVGVALDGNDVYVAGHFPDTTFAGGYWKNGVWNAINNGSFSPSSVSNTGGNIYIPGNAFTRTATSYTQKAAYWANGQLTYLNGQQAFAMTVSGADIYVAGIDNNNTIVVWKNGTVISTLGTAGNLNITSMAIAN